MPDGENKGWQGSLLRGVLDDELAEAASESTEPRSASAARMRKLRSLRRSVDLVLTPSRKAKKLQVTRQLLNRVRALVRESGSLLTLSGYLKDPELATLKKAQTRKGRPIPMSNEVLREILKQHGLLVPSARGRPRKPFGI